MHDEARTGGGHQRAGMQDRAMPGVMQYRMEVVIAERVLALRHQVHTDRAGPAEQLQHLVQQVRPQIHPQPAAGRIAFAPALAHLWAEAVEVGMAFGDAADTAAVDHLLEREEVGIVAAVLENGHHAVGVVRGLHHRFGFRHGQRERFVHQHMFAGRQCRACQRCMRIVGRGDHHRVHRRVVEHRLRVIADAHVGEAAQQAIPLRADDAVQCKPWRMQDQRRMEHAARQPVADQGDLKCGGHGALQHDGAGQRNGCARAAEI